MYRTFFHSVPATTSFSTTASTAQSSILFCTSVTCPTNQRLPRQHPRHHSWRHRLRHRQSPDQLQQLGVCERFSRNPSVKTCESSWSTFVALRCKTRGFFIAFSDEIWRRWVDSLRRESRQWIWSYSCAHWIHERHFAQTRMFPFFLVWINECRWSLDVCAFFCRSSSVSACVEMRRGIVFLLMQDGKVITESDHVTHNSPCKL